ncbi:MAG TPA: hypothetical protein PLR83_04710 [Pyrinomonadaceae bacterium]|nr:hypothetical protein [Pyrinomonadaceae bacterium]
MSFLTRARNERELWFVGLLSIIIFVPGIGWGLPHATHPLAVHGWDLGAVAGLPTLVELHHLFVAPQPDWYLAYPPFHYLVLGSFYAPYIAFLYVTGGLSGTSSQYPFGFHDPVAALQHLALIGRGVSVLMASGVVVSCYVTARTIWDRKAARFAAAAVALPTPIFYNARVGTLDIPLLFWESLCILMIARCLVFGFTAKRGIWLGVFCAFAVATKDQAFGPLAFGVLALLTIYFLRHKADISVSKTWKFPVALGLSGLIVFAFASGLLFSPHRFFGHFVYIRNYEQNFFGILGRFGQPATAAGYAVLTWEVLTELFFSIGPIFLAVGFAGLILTFRANPFTRVLCAMLIGHLILVVWAVRFTQFRYVMLATYIFSFFIARALALTFRKKSPRWLVPAAVTFSILGFGWLGLRCVNLIYQMHYDSRYQAGKWIDQQSKPGDQLAFFTSQNVVPPFDGEVRVIKLFADPAPMEKLVASRPRFILAQPDFASKIGSDRSYFFPNAIYDELGNMGYTASAKFETPPLFSGLLLNDTLVGPGYYVNPPITVFELTKK